MRYSYSRVECFAKCPYQYKLRYIDGLSTLPDQSADNALYLGTAIHKAFETGDMEAGIQEYKSNYYMITDLVENEIIKLEYFIPKVLDLLPPGICEVKVSTQNYVGYIDRLAPLFTDENGVGHYAIYDYKYANPNSFPKYLESPQLSLYKWYLEETDPTAIVDELKYVFIPKVNIRQKKTETLQEFRSRLQESLESSEIKIESAPYIPESIPYFEECCKRLDTVTDFPKNKSRLCAWCQYEKYCSSGGDEDWMICEKLPKND